MVAESILSDAALYLPVFGSSSSLSATISNASAVGLASEGITQISMRSKLPSASVVTHSNVEGVSLNLSEKSVLA